MNISIKNKTQDTRQQILDSAKTVILGKGFAAAGLNEILSSASVPKGSFYHYFKSKEQFGTELLQDYFSDYIIMQNQYLNADDRSPAERLLAYFDYWINSQTSPNTEDKCLVVKLSGEVADLSESMRLALLTGTASVIDNIARTLQEAQAQGEIANDTDPQTLANELYYMWIGATLITKLSHSRSALDCAMETTRQKLHR